MLQIQQSEYLELKMISVKDVRNCFKTFWRSEWNFGESSNNFVFAMIVSHFLF